DEFRLYLEKLIRNSFAIAGINWLARLCKKVLPTYVLFTCQTQSPVNLDLRVFIRGLKPL
ncbi:hypothetical protein, partial [Lentibacillus salicampi]|uniref:hypothetical protein n=1 Tax=Lentibacillus salicampi TaxID=175306 RepID=UPI001ADD8B18